MSAVIMLAGSPDPGARRGSGGKVFENAKIVVKQVAREADVKATQAKVELGEADAGVVYVTDVLSAGDKVEGVQIPADVNASTSTRTWWVCRSSASPADVAHLRHELLGQGGREIGLVLKVETTQSFAALHEILLDGLRWPRLGVLIARGDLMTEIGWEQMSEVPHQIMSLCETAHVPVIWATQVLEPLAKRGVPSRAELMNAAEAQRAECVMLNKGPYILDAVATLAAVLRRMRRVQRKGRTLLRRISSW